MENNTLFCPGPALSKPEQTTVTDYLIHQSKHFERLGRTTFLVDGITDEKRHYKDFDDETRKVASQFYKKGLRKGDIVIYMSTHQIRQVLLMTGVWRANGVARSLYAEEAMSTILDKVLESKARWIFCDPEEVEAVLKEVVSKCTWPVEVIIAMPTDSIPTGCVSFDEYINDDGTECPEIAVTEDDLALILPTSGTTGPSKGAMHSHKSTLATIRTFSRLYWSHPKWNLVASKSTHISGFGLPLALLVHGGTGIVLPKVNKEILIKAVDKYKPGLVFGFPTYLLALGSSDANGFDISSVETLVTGGGTTTESMRQEFLKIGNVTSVLNVYGLTEGGATATISNMFENPQSITYADCPARSVGRPYPGTTIQIRGLTDSSEVLGPHQNGEIWAKGDFTFVGYYKNSEATKETISDGWIRTGDVGYFDEKGYLYIVDRQKDIFKYVNNHISPTELENVIFKHPSVKEVCVVAVPDEMGEIPRAFVTIKSSRLGQNLTTVAEEIKAFANDKLASYKQLRGGLHIVEELPKGKTGKVERKMVMNLVIPTY